MIKYQIKKILVPLDGSKNSFRALAKAIGIAKQTNSSITGITVIEAFPTEIRTIRKTIRNAFTKRSNDFLTIAKQKCSKENVSFLDIIEFGPEGKTIVSFAQKNNFDLIVIGSRGMGSLKEMFLGSTSNYVVHTSKIPVMVIK